MGKELSDQQAEQLLAASDRFTIFLDGGQPGCHAAKKVTSRLIHRAFVRVIRFPDGPKRKPAHLERQELKKLLTMQKPSL